MLMVLAYCHRDADSAWRLMQWMEHLGQDQRFDCLLAANPIAHSLPVDAKIQAKAKSLFRRVHYHVAEVNEKGWPASANEMFVSAMRQAAKLDDALWIEPDAVPIVPDWLDVLNQNWVQAKAQGKHFMGTRMERPAPAHLSGVAVYSQDWEQVAPRLANTPPNTGWDLYAGPEVIPHSHCVTVIQNEWNPRPGARDRLQEGCVLYHQCKTGALMQTLAHERGQTFSPESDTKYTMRYFKTTNASRKYRFQNWEIKFEIYEILGGVPSGIFASDDKELLTAMDSIMAKKNCPIQEIKQAEYDELAKKKIRTPGYLDSRVLSQREWSGKVAVPVEAKELKPIEPEPKEEVVPLETVVQVAPVVPAQPVALPKQKPKKV